MSGIGEAGDIVAGAMLASVVEPGHGRARAAEHGQTCLNCSAQLTGAYCAECGQSAHLHRSFGAVWHELMHGVLHMDGKIWRTLPELAFRPGKLTRRYVAGERAKFVSPFALFLFSALLLYATASIFESKNTSADAQESARQMQKQIAKLDERIADTEGSLRDPNLSANRRARLQERLKDARDDRHELAAASAIVGDVGKGAAGAVGGRSVMERMETNREFVSYRLKANAYKFSWALILISTPLVWLLFAWRRDYGLYDHATFVTYSISFMSLLFAIYTAGSGLGLVSGVLMLALMLYALWHMYVQMRDAYRLSRTGALLRLPLLYGIAATAGGIFYGLLTATNG
jgi:ABC-type multidrug transport system fused ATPase/permease subunit